MEAPIKLVSAGGQIRFKKPDKEWLESYYCIPPIGRGATIAEIAEIAGCSSNLVAKWINRFGITESQRDRMRFHSTGEFVDFPKPSKGELEAIYCLPPRGRGMSRREIAEMYSVSEGVIRSWIEEYDINSYDRVTRSRFHSTGIVNEVSIPDRQELADMYLLPPEGMGLSLDAIGEHYGVNRLTVSKWVEEHDLTQDSLDRIAHHNSGENNYFFKGGASRNYHKSVLLKKNPDMICEWCNNKNKVQVHHIDHDTENGHSDNLMWLCHHCNMIEAHAHNLTEKGFANWQIVMKDGKRRLIVEFIQSERVD